MLPSAELLPLSASPSLSQGQVGVTGAAGPAGARGRAVSHLVSLSPFGMIVDGGGGHVCDQEHQAGLKLVSPGFFLTPKQGGTGLRGPPGPQGLEGAKGDPGPRGRDGPTGAAGLEGPAGDEGAKGDRGQPGPTRWGCCSVLCLACSPVLEHWAARARLCPQHVCPAGLGGCPRASRRPRVQGILRAPRSRRSGRRTREAGPAGEVWAPWGHRHGVERRRWQRGPSGSNRSPAPAACP
ncbi:hypothetical protein LUU34_00592800 [Aix galericulata]|nr:hypothetical protein LUU34_00592800 [Aix galericulata]